MLRSTLAFPKGFAHYAGILDSVENAKWTNSITTASNSIHEVIWATSDSLRDPFNVISIQNKRRSKFGQCQIWHSFETFDSNFKCPYHIFYLFILSVRAGVHLYSNSILM